MKTEETKIIKSKQLVWKGKEYTETLTEEDMAQMKRTANVCKLNGWGQETYLDLLYNHVEAYWKDEAIEVFNEASPELKVGLGATMNLYTDHRAMTIIKIITPRKIIVQENKTRCIDYYAGSYEVLDEIAEHMRQSTFTLRRGGTWVEEGQPKKRGSVTLTVGFRRHYIDPCF